MRRAAENSSPLRIFGRERTCFGGDLNLEPNRVNVLILDGKVLWAARF